MPPFLTTHTGSLPRPTDLSQLLYDREDGKPTPGLDDRVRSAVNEVVQKQVECAVDVVNDGEMGKIGYSTYVKDRLTGFAMTAERSERRIPAGDEFPDLDQVRRPAQPGLEYIFTAECVGDIRPRDTQAVDADIATLQHATQGSGAQRVFMTAASPGVITRFIPDKHYGNHETYVAAVADAMQPEYRAIVQAGITLQIDCPDLAMVRGGFPDLSAFRRFCEINVEALNHALQGLPEDRLRIHICWGNYEGPHTRDVELQDVIDIILKVRASGISLEACNPRHGHEWRVFEDVKLPDGRYVIPGVIDSTTNFVEHPDLVAERLMNYARVVGADNVMAGTDCGFGTFAGVSSVAPSVVWAKLRSMSEGARRAAQRAGALASG